MMHTVANLQSERLLGSQGSAYHVGLARDDGEVRLAQALRYEVFNLELGEGLQESHATGLDADRFDAVCDHLLVTQRSSGRVVGTYRLQTGAKAAAHLGYYCAQEFDFGPFEPIRSGMIELGRACVAADHRNLQVLGLLWKAIARYAQAHGARYLVGCSSVTSQDPAVGATMHANLHRRHLAPLPWRTRPLPKFECPADALLDDAPKVPKLLRAYLGLGAWICGPPALDREFRTIDFLTLLDFESLPVLVKSRLLEP